MRDSRPSKEGDLMPLCAKTMCATPLWPYRLGPGELFLSNAPFIGGLIDIYHMP